MKPSYAIGAKNGLLDQKHLNALGQALWLYLWFLDKQVKDTDLVLGGKPITYQMFSESFPDVPRRTYGLWLDKVKAGGYIEMLRTPHGYVVTITKPKKWAKSDVQNTEQHSKRDVSKTAHRRKSDVQDPALDVQESEHHMAEYGTSNIRETIDIQEETILPSEDKPVAYGKPEINEIFDSWENIMGYKIQGKQTANRRAASNLLKKYNRKGVEQLLHVIDRAQRDRYSGLKVADFAAMQFQINDIIAYAKKLRSTTYETPSF